MILFGIATAIAAYALPPLDYVCARASQTIIVDGSLDDPGWRGCRWTEDFVDIEGDKGAKPRFRTRAKMAWDDQGLYILAEMEEPHLWATLTEHDSVIYKDNDFEVFLDPNGDGDLYAELEVNALNTTWDLLLIKPYRDGGPALDGWELKGLQTAVGLTGTLNHPSDQDTGWVLEVGIPWSALREIAGTRCPPLAGDTWRINFSRVQWQLKSVNGAYVKVPDAKEDNWVWSPQGLVDMHRPETWGRVTFKL